MKRFSLECLPFDVLLLIIYPLSLRTKKSLSLTSSFFLNIVRSTITNVSARPSNWIQFSEAFQYIRSLKIISANVKGREIYVERTNALKELDLSSNYLRYQGAQSIATSNNPLILT